MGKRKKQTDIEGAIADDKAIEAKKNSTLTEDEERALHYRHCREYETKLNAKKLADAALKNVAKLIKSEGDSVVKVKKTIRARTPEGEAELMAEMEETAEVLRWSGVSVGETKELFPEDRTPAVDRAKAEGKRAGLDGQPCRSPHDPSVPQYQAWIDGWHEGQAILMSAFAKAPTMPPESDSPNTADTSVVPFRPQDDEARVPA